MMSADDTKSDTLQYHLSEFRIANDPRDPHRVLPKIPRECRSILEVGCGAGATLSACEVGLETLLCGVDVDRSALTLGRQLVPRVHFVQGRGESLPLDSREFDFVIVRVSLPYMDITRALDEFARVLRPGGQIWVVLHPCTMVMQDLFRSLRKLNLRDSLYRFYVIFNGLSMHLTGRVFHLPFRPGRFESYQTARSIRRALLAAGFVDIEVSRDRFFVVTALKP